MSDTQQARAHYREAVRLAGLADHGHGHRVNRQAERDMAHVHAHLAEVALLLADESCPEPWHALPVADRNIILSALAFTREKTGSDGGRADVAGLLERLGGGV